MILSSSDILKVLKGDAMVALESVITVVDGKPGYDAGDKVYIYIDKYPTVEDFQATWKIWVRDISEMGEYVLSAMTALLPNFELDGEYYSTTELATSNTVVKTQEEIDREEFQSRFSGLQKGLEQRLTTLSDGRDGIDGRDGVDGLPGRDGKDGRDGRDGQDLVATDAELFDLQNVEEGITLEPGQVLTFDGLRWTNLYTRQVSTLFGGGGGGGSSDVQELNDLTDVSTDGVADGQFLQYNGSTGEFEPASVAPGSGIMPELDPSAAIRRHPRAVDVAGC